VTRVDHHVAQVNIALPLEPPGSELLQSFMDQLEPINALADAAPGFIWRLQTEDGDATAIRPYEDERLLINMSVWESLEAFAGFVYGTDHAAVMRQRRQWFVPMRESYSAAWWIEAGAIPTPADAVARLDHLRAHGSSEYAFTVAKPFPRPGDVIISTRDDWTCPV
jgi:heme-degrading monooxygenase HmoA